LTINDCQFKDNFSSSNGAVFYVYNGVSFNAMNIKAYNSSAYGKVIIYLFFLCNLISVNIIRNQHLILKTIKTYI